jgi:hypothetical protein
MNKEQSHQLWCKNQHNLIRNGGVWTVPRSGMIFTRTPKGFELTLVMPFLPEMTQALERDPEKDIPKTPEELLAYQRSDFRCIQRHFKAAGLEISDPKGMLGL